MENYRKFIDPDDMTPEEQTERIIELLAIACIRFHNDVKMKASQGQMDSDINQGPVELDFDPQTKVMN